MGDSLVFRKISTTKGGKVGKFVLKCMTSLVLNDTSVQDAIGYGCLTSLKPPMIIALEGIVTSWHAIPNGP